ncbi:hypothetical protein B0A49_09605 [Cryomyces minteri]|uniref:Malate dehydrogenase n=1 Tax=Cryomyces minteri TaxID=331657 RepID=A0A4U0WEN6_9PEZI|nr:hypothetical protein B0A49_09605 [Cryomyces minteri]
MLSPSLSLLTTLGLLLTTTLALPTAAPPFHVRAKQSAAPSLPASTLPPPPAGTTLKYVALGLGTQNYTCASPSASSPPMPAGALATLYDATARLSLPSGAVQIPKLPATSLKSSNGLGLPQLGQHYFTVETAGGKAGSCEGVGAGGMQVAYAAEYWFYG